MTYFNVKIPRIYICENPTEFHIHMDHRRHRHHQNHATFFAVTSVPRDTYILLGEISAGGPRDDFPSTKKL